MGRAWAKIESTGPVETFDDLDADYNPVGFWDRLRGKKHPQAELRRRQEKCAADMKVVDQRLRCHPGFCGQLTEDAHVAAA